MDIHQLFSDKSDLYARVRPQHPSEVYDYLAHVTPHHGLAWDCACGSGQVAIDLVKRFDRVEATDVSPEQIAQAPRIQGVTFSVSAAESTPFEDQVFDIICVGQALHWLDYDRFWPEVDRLLKPGGVFAAWGYIFPNMNAEIDAVVQKSLYAVVEPYWAEQNRLLWNHYRDVEIPYRELVTPKIEFSIDWSLDELLTYIQTWSAVRRCKEALGNDFYVETCARVSELWGERSRLRRIHMDFCFLASQKDS